MINMLIEKIDNITKEKLKGKIIAFPTDTVFGVGALIDDEVAINKIYDMKERDFNKPLAILASKIEDIMPYIEKPCDKALDYMNKYWPGALTIIFKKSNKVSASITKGLDTIAFRIPNNEDALRLLHKTGPLATTSVNISGDAPINDYIEIEKVFGDKIDYLFAKNAVSSNKSSTIIDASTENIKVLRQGEINV